MSIDGFLASMNANGGMSVANHFVVHIANALSQDGDPTGYSNVYRFLCDEAQLPNTQAATGTVKGRYMGEGAVNYPHTRIFTEMQLGFQCDANMTPLKFLNNWYGAIFKEYADEGVRYPQMDNATGNHPTDHHKQKVRLGNRTVQLSYPDEYCSKIYVTKTELGPKDTGGMRSSLTYVMDRAWPFAIDAVPLQFGSASITKVTAQFYYSKHYVIAGDINAARVYEKKNNEDLSVKALNRGLEGY